MPTITVNDITIPHAAIAREVQNQDAPSPKAAWDGATRALIVRELLLQRAQALGLEAEPLTQDGARETEDEALIRALLEQEVRTPEADETSCRRYYESNQARFRAPDLFEPLHILFKAPREDKEAHDRAVARAESVLAEIAAHPDRFESLARALSDCPSASEGGRLGLVTGGDTTPEFEAALRGMQAGETLTTPLTTRYGVHVVRLERTVAGAVLPFEHVHERIAAYLQESVWRRAVAQYVGLLAGQARIQGFTMPGASSPLVQ